MKYIFVLFLFISTLFAQQKLLQPDSFYTISQGLATDTVYANKKLYIASDSGRVDIFSTKSKKQLQEVTLSKIKDFMGDEIDSKIFSIDLADGALLILSQDNGGYSRVHIYKNKKLTLIISGDEHLNITKAKFINKHTILLALISNDIISYDMNTKKRDWTVQASESKFSDFALNNSKDLVAVTDESGDVHVLSVKNGKNVKTFTGQNVDNVFSIAFRGNTILTGGQDRRAAVFNIKSSSAYYKMADFFVYGVGLSPSGKIGAYSYDTNNDVELFNTVTRESLGKYKVTKKVLNGICFINEKEFFVTTRSPKVAYYKIK
jgi:hypothetical protein